MTHVCIYNMLVWVRVQKRSRVYGDGKLFVKYLQVGTCGRGFFSLVFFLPSFLYFVFSSAAAPPPLARHLVTHHPRRYYSIRPPYKCTAAYKRRIARTLRTTSSLLPAPTIARDGTDRPTDRPTDTNGMVKKSLDRVTPHRTRQPRSLQYIYMKGNPLCVYIGILHTHTHDRLASASYTRLYTYYIHMWGQSERVFRWSWRPLVHMKMKQIFTRLDDDLYF